MIVTVSQADVFRTSETSETSETSVVDGRFEGSVAAVTASANEVQRKTI